MLKSKYLKTKLTSEEVDQLCDQYCDYLIRNGAPKGGNYLDFWENISEYFINAKIKNKLNDLEPKLRMHQVLRLAFLESINKEQNSKIERCERDPFHRFRERMFGEDKPLFNQMVVDLNIAYNDYLYLNRVDPSKPYEYEHKKGGYGFMSKFIHSYMDGKYENSLPLFNAQSIIHWCKDYVFEDEDSNVFEDIASQYNKETATALLDITKTTLLNNIVKSVPLKDALENTRKDMKSKIPEALGYIVFAKSFYRTCLVIIPEYMTEKERAIFENRPFGGVVLVGQLKGSQISTRSTASFARAITSVEHHGNTVRAEGSRPRNRAYGELRAKPPK